LEITHADYFLSYGSGIHAPTSEALPTTARFVPVGSTRLEAMRKRWSKLHVNNVFTVLWIAEISCANTVCSAWLVEDTTRFRLERECLELLNRNNIKVIYRPFPADPKRQAMNTWLKRRRLKNVSVNRTARLDELIFRSDLVVTDTSSNTTWNEVLVIGRPLVLFCDPAQTLMNGDFKQDLEKVCCWCKSEEELLTILEQVVDGKRRFKVAAHSGARQQDEFLRKYVLHDGGCVQRVINVLKEVTSPRTHTSGANPACKNSRAAL
jgi:hypothetical protein